MSAYASRIAFEFHFDADDPNGAVAKTREIETAIVVACDSIGVGVPDRISEVHIAPRAAVVPCPEEEEPNG